MIFFFFSIAPPLVLESMRAREQLRRLQEEKISMIFLLLILSQRYINYWEKQCHVGCPYSEGKAIKPTKLNLGAKKINLKSSYHRFKIRHSQAAETTDCHIQPYSLQLLYIKI